jgi:hypothetical protein
MSVIGRLDEQVESILISPLGKKRDAPEQPEQPSAQETNTLREEESSAQETRTRSPELPVWLL